MRRSRAFIAIIGGVGFLVAAGCVGRQVAAAGRSKVVRVSVEPSYSLPTMNQKYRPLLKLLEQRTGYRIEMVSALSYGNYLSSVEGARVDVGFMNPLAYLTTHKTRGAYLLAKATDWKGLDQYRGVIIVRKGSRIRSCKDLRGRTIATISRRAPASYLSPRARCVQDGMDPEQEATILPVGTLNEVVRKVLDGSVDAGFVREEALAVVRDEMGTEERIEVLAYGPYVPTWCFAAFRDTDPAVAGAFQKALLALDRRKAEDAEALEAAGSAGFAPASDHDYDAVRRMANDLRYPY